MILAMLRILQKPVHETARFQMYTALQTFQSACGANVGVQNFAGGSDFFAIGKES